MFSEISNFKIHTRYVGWILWYFTKFLWLPPKNGEFLIANIEDFPRFPEYPLNKWKFKNFPKLSKTKKYTDFTPNIFLWKSQKSTKFNLFIIWPRTKLFLCLILVFLGFATSHFGSDPKLLNCFSSGRTNTVLCYPVV